MSSESLKYPTMPPTPTPAKNAHNLSTRLEPRFTVIGVAAGGGAGAAAGAANAPPPSFTLVDKVASVENKRKDLTIGELFEQASRAAEAQTRVAMTGKIFRMRLLMTSLVVAAAIASCVIAVHPFYFNTDETCTYRRLPFVKASQLYDLCDAVRFQFPAPLCADPRVAEVSRSPISDFLDMITIAQSTRRVFVLFYNPFCPISQQVCFRWCSSTRSAGFGVIL